MSKTERYQRARNIPKDPNNPESRRQRRKAKLLAVPVIDDNMYKPTKDDTDSQAAYTSYRESIYSGVSIKSESADFRTAIEHHVSNDFPDHNGNKMVDFLVKPNTSPTYKVAADLLRVALDDECCAIKRVSITKTKKYAIKWSSHLTPLFEAERITDDSGNEIVVHTLTTTKKELKVGENSKGEKVKKYEDVGYFSEEEKEKIGIGHANLCGALGVFGEHDWNPQNSLVDKRTGRVVKIDIECCMYFGHRIFGSAQTRDFLYKLAGNPAYTSVSIGYDKSRQAYEDFEKIFLNIRSAVNDGKIDDKPLFQDGVIDDILEKGIITETDHEMLKISLKHLPESKKKYSGISDSFAVAGSDIDNMPSYCRDMVRAYKSWLINYIYNFGIDDHLFNNIKVKLNSPDAQEAAETKKLFMSFMSGMTNSIALSKDSEFLDAYIKKYKEVGDDVSEKSEKIKLAFKKNGRDAEELYAPLIDLYRQIQEEDSKIKKENEGSDTSKESIAAVEDSKRKNSGGGDIEEEIKRSKPPMPPAKSCRSAAGRHFSSEQNPSLRVGVSAN